MTMTDADARAHRWLHGLWFLTSLGVTIGWMVLRWSGVALHLPWNAVLPGIVICGSAFLLCWAAELAELEFSQALALAAVALMTVLPEYAVDLYFAWKAGQNPAYTAYAAANMTGANRLLIGVGWPLLFAIFWWRTRARALHVGREQSPELAALLLATVYSLIIPLKRTLSWLDTIVLLVLFGYYLLQAARAERSEPELTGPAKYLAQLSAGPRRAVTAALFVMAGLAIVLAAEPFAEGLLELGRHAHIEEFLLVQWLAPLASEFPEFLVAILFVLHRKAGAGFGALVSSKVNQWTLLVGMLPLAYSLGSHGARAMALDDRQVEEILLTSAQSLFAVAILADFEFSRGDAWLLAVPFIMQLSLPFPAVRWGFCGFYLLGFCCLCAQARRRQALIGLVRGFFQPAR